MRLNDFPWFILFPLLASLLPVGIWVAHGLVLPFTSIGPPGMRKRFLKVYAVVGLGLTLGFGVQYLMLGLSM